LPKDITISKAEFHYPKKVKLRSYNPTVKGHAGQIRKAVDLILSAKRPMLYTGGGVILSDGSPELIELAQLLGYPITNTLMGLGAYPATDKQFVGMLGMHGTYEANLAMHHCDVLIAIGARFDDRVTGKIDKFCPEAQDRPCRHRSLLDFQECPGRYPHRRFGAERATGDDQRDPRREAAPDTEALARWWRQIDEWRATKS
jgi:acetolactate synthase-1/2/3 large subunit